MILKIKSKLSHLPWNPSDLDSLFTNLLMDSLEIKEATESG